MSDKPFRVVPMDRTHDRSTCKNGGAISDPAVMIFEKPDSTS